MAILKNKKGQILIETLISLISLITLILLSIKGIKNAYRLNKKYQHKVYQKNKFGVLIKKPKLQFKKDGYYV